MDYQAYEVLTIGKDALDSSILTIKPRNGVIFSFLSGQFCELRIPHYNNELKRAHFFSIASPPTNQTYLEFGFKIYGEWTKRLSESKVGDEILIKGPYGKFIWDASVWNTVFLAGGIGITPFMSFLRFIRVSNQKPLITLIYGNRTEGHIAYRKEVEQIIASLPSSKVVHVLSDVKEGDQWNGHRGFLTKEILEKEVNFTLNPMFFVCGPPVFVKLAKEILQSFSIPENRIEQELF